MDPKIIWLFVFVLLYWGYCIFFGFVGALQSRTASDYFIGGHRISFWVFVLAATATSFSGWTFMGHPGLIFRDGFQYAYASFYAITIPFTGVLFLKRQWMLGKRFGFVTPGEMLATYFRSDAIRILVVLVALVFSVPYLGLQLRASGFLFHVLTDGVLSINAGMWALSFVLVIYVAIGGLRAVAYVDVAQVIMLSIGIVSVGSIALYHVGGLGDLSERIFALAQQDTTTTPAGYSHYVAIPGVIQAVKSGPSAQGGAWTGMMILTYMFALMGIQSAPAFSMWAFSNESARPFAVQQVWASSLIVGFLLIFFTACQGMAGHFLGADASFMQVRPDMVNDVMSDQLLGQDLMETRGAQGNLVPQLIYLASDVAPWFAGLLAVCALAAMQSTGAAYMATAGGILTRDVLKRFFMPEASDSQQMVAGRTIVVLIVVAALIVATTSSDALSLLGGLAVAYGFQMWPALIAVCWWPWLTRQGVTVGLLLGLIAVTLTESIGSQLFPGLPWGRWPLTMHSAFWGLLFNLVPAILISAVTQNTEDRRRRMIFHNFLRSHAGLPQDKRSLIPVAWIVTIAWFFFGVGPGAVIGNTIFGRPDDMSTWMFGLPSIWVWQILFWALGVVMMAFLAYKMELSTMPKREVHPLADDVDKLEGDFDRLADDGEAGSSDGHAQA